MVAKPPFSFTAADLSNIDFGIVWPDKSSMAAGKLSDARTLQGKKVSLNKDDFQEKGIPNAA